MKRLVLAVLLLISTQLSAASVTLQRVPDNGLEPQVAVDSKGVVHLIYFTGEDKAGDIIYRTSATAGRTWSEPIRVNSIPASALIVGAVRGPELAVDTIGRPHVIWSGSDAAQPNPRLVGLPLVYSRLDRHAFLPQRNLIASGVGLDGGASIAAHGTDIDIVWHAPPAKDGAEQSRKLWLLNSRDDFATRTELSMPRTGVCACCASHVFYDNDVRHVLFRGADQLVHRDTYLDDRKLSEWRAGQCVMSTCDSAGGLIAWESKDTVIVADVAGKSRAQLGTKNPKHPRLAVSQTAILVTWTENTAWHKGGGVHWQLLDRDLKPLDGLENSGKADDLPAWGYPAAFATPDGSFIILY